MPAYTNSSHKHFLSPQYSIMVIQGKVRLPTGGCVVQADWGNVRLPTGGCVVQADWGNMRLPTGSITVKTSISVVFKGA